ncbi:Cysteine-rich protein 2-binding protein [Balamuthia mandrillaris]
MQPPQAHRGAAAALALPAGGARGDGGGNSHGSLPEAELVRRRLQQFRAKLALRQKKRKRGLPPFNLDRSAKRLVSAKRRVGQQLAAFFPEHYAAAFPLKIRPYDDPLSSSSSFHAVKQEGERVGVFPRDPPSPSPPTPSPPSSPYEFPPPSSFASSSSSSSSSSSLQQQQTHQDEQEQNESIPKDRSPHAVYFRERLEGYRLPASSPLAALPDSILNTRLAQKPMVSPYTLRRLPPFIRRDYESRPLRPALLRELMTSVEEWRRRRRERRTKKEQAKETEKEKEGEEEEEEDSAEEDEEDEERKKERRMPVPIDYTYVCFLTPAMMDAVHRLLRDCFWPGISVDECTNYPDYTIVALYKRMVVGCAFMTPEAYILYIAVHPEWRRCGIATFMLYHLIQSCPTKDVTLHVSATNKAMILYQKFGFKPEEFIVGFYSQYYPPDDTETCLNALFMRLRR